MRALIVEHHDKPTVGVIGETLHDLGVQLDTVWGVHGDPLPATADEHNAVVVLGGTMTALDDEVRPYFPALTRLIHDFAAADKPVLGVCLGAQLIARSFGAELHLGGDLEFGFHTVTPTDAAATDPVLRHLDRPLPLFQWHTDHYALPPGAQRLATGSSYENQAYRIGRNVYGMQFHFEVTRSLVEGQIEESPELDEQAPGHRDWLPGQFDRHEEASNEFCRTVAGRWIELA